MVEAGKSYFCTSLTRTLILDSCKETQTFLGTLRFLSSRRATLSRQISALATESPRVKKYRSQAWNCHSL